MLEWKIDVVFDECLFMCCVFLTFYHIPLNVYCMFSSTVRLCKTMNERLLPQMPWRRELPSNQFNNYLKAWLHDVSVYVHAVQVAICNTAWCVLKMPSFCNKYFNTWELRWNSMLFCESVVLYPLFHCKKLSINFLCENGYRRLFHWMFTKFTHKN